MRLRDRIERLPSILTRPETEQPPEPANGVEFESMDDLADRIDTQKTAVAQTEAKLQRERDHLRDLVGQMGALIEARKVLDASTTPYILED